MASRAAPRKKPTPLRAFLEPVSTATRRKSAFSPSPATYFTASDGAHLGEILRHPRERLRTHHVGHRHPLDPARLVQGEDHQRDDLQAQPGEQGLVETAASPDPTTEQVGHDPHELIEQEQEGERHRRVAEVVEVQEHQHPKVPSVRVNAQYPAVTKA